MSQANTLRRASTFDKLPRTRLIRSQCRRPHQSTAPCVCSRCPKQARTGRPRPWPSCAPPKSMRAPSSTLRECSRHSLPRTARNMNMEATSAGIRPSISCATLSPSPAWLLARSANTFWPPPLGGGLSLHTCLLLGGSLFRRGRCKFHGLHLLLVLVDVGQSFSQFFS